MAAGWLLSADVQADGEELLPSQGASAVGRGGATAALPSDAGTLTRNPAGLPELGRSQGLYGFDLAIDANCVEPYGYYGWGVYLPEAREGAQVNRGANLSEFGDSASTAYGARRLDKVCNSSAILPLPHLAVALQLSDRWSIGFGLLAPVIVSGANWGGKDGTIAVNGPDGVEARPTPTRYTMIRAEGFGLNVVGGVGYKATPWLSLGLNLQVGAADGTQYVVSALRAGTSPANDMLTKVHVSDLFIPALTLGVYMKPSRRWRIGGTFVWSDDFDGSGELTYTTNYYHQGAGGTEALPFENDPIKLKRAVVTAPWTATLAIGYSQPLSAAAEGENDPLTRDLWDLELDASFTNNEALGANTVEVAEDFSLRFKRADGARQMPVDVKRSDLSELSVERHMKNVVALRMGGGWNVLPGSLQVSAGAFYQSRGTDPNYASVTSFGLQRLGFGLGARVRLGPVDLVAAYSHIFQETLEVAPPPHEPREEDGGDPLHGFDQRIYEDGELSERPKRDLRTPSPSAADGVASARQSAVFESQTLRARVINAGRYSAGFDVFSISLVHGY